MISKLYSFDRHQNSIKKFVPLKSLGQNFLISPHVRKKIIHACQLKKTDVVLEIGAGTGILTREIACHVHKVIAIEKDKRLAEKLKHISINSNIEITMADFLKFPFKNLPSRLKIIGNLPYNIATPIIERLLQHRHYCSDIFITVQLEYGQRIVAQANTKSYGSLSCFVQYYAQAEKLFLIKNTSFYPTPKVQSCFIHLKPHPPNKIKANNERLLFQMIRQAFQQRRKVILNSLAKTTDKKLLLAFLHQCKIDPRKRAENLSLNDYIQIANLVDKLGNYKT